MLITVIVILDIVLAAFVMATFAIAERNYTEQVKHFSEVQASYEERGEIEAAKGRIRKVVSDLQKATVSDTGTAFVITIPSQYTGINPDVILSPIVDGQIMIPNNASNIGKADVKITTGTVSAVYTITCEKTGDVIHTAIEQNPPEVTP